MISDNIKHFYVVHITFYRRTFKNNTYISYFSAKLTGLSDCEICHSGEQKVQDWLT